MSSRRSWIGNPMASARKILDEVLRGSSDANVAFRDLRQLLISLGFTERISGGHHTFRRAGVRELINIQKEGNKAKAVSSSSGTADHFRVQSGRQPLTDKYEV